MMPRTDRHPFTAQAQGIRSAFTLVTRLIPSGKSIPMAKASGKMAATEIPMRASSGSAAVSPKSDPDPR